MRRCRAATLFLAGALALAGPACAADAVEQMQVAGQARTYAIHVPDGRAPADGFPLVLAFHGGGMQGQGMRRLTGFDALADARRFIVVYPDGIDKHWNDGRSTIKHPQDDVRFVAELIDELERRHPVDRARTYAAGLSNGALFAQRLGCALSGRIAAIASVAGTMPKELGVQCRPSRPVALLQISGTADPIMPFDGGDVADFGGRGEGGQVQSAARTTSFWARHNGCAASPALQALPPRVALDRTRLMQARYSGCVAGGEVELLTVAGGGHAWPGGAQFAPRRVIGVVSRQLDASQAIVDFFLAQPAALPRAG